MQQMGGGTLSLLMTHAQVRQNLLAVKSFVEFVHKYNQRDLFVTWSQDAVALWKSFCNQNLVNQAKLCYILNCFSDLGKGEGERVGRRGEKTTVSAGLHKKM